MRADIAPGAACQATAAKLAVVPGSSSVAGAQIEEAWLLLLFKEVASASTNLALCWQAEQRGQDLGTKAYEVTAFSTLVQLLLTVEAVQRHWQKKGKSQKDFILWNHEESEKNNT